MKLFKISQTANGGYDTYDSAVVAAKDKKAARETNPSPGYRWNSTAEEWQYNERSTSQGSWVAPKDVKVEEIGLARKGIKAGVIVSSFNAG